MPMRSLQFHPVHGFGVKLLKNRGIAKTEDTISNGSHGFGYVFSDGLIKVEERVCIQVVELNDPANLKIGFTRTNPESFPKSLLGYSNNKAPPTVQVAECWLQESINLNFNPTRKIAFYITKKGEIHLEIDGISKGIVASEVEGGGPLWAVIECRHEAQIQTIGRFEIEPVKIAAPMSQPVIKTPTIQGQPAQKPKKTAHIRKVTRSTPATKNRFGSFEDEDEDDDDEEGEEESQPSKKGRSRHRKPKPKEVFNNSKGQPLVETSSNITMYIVISVVIVLLVLLSKLVNWLD